MEQKRGKGLIVFLGLMTALAPLSTDMYLPALPKFQSDFSIAPSMAQMTLTMTMIGMAIGQVLGGPISDRFGRKWPMLWGMVFFCFASLSCFLADNIYVFLFSRLIQGTAGAFGIVIARAVARDVCSGPELMRCFGILMMVNGLAPILAPVAGGEILKWTDWRGIFAVLVGIGLLQTGETFFFRETLPREGRSGSAGASFSNFPKLLKDGYFRGHCLVQCFVFAAFFSYLAGSTFLFQNVYGVSPQVYSYIFGGIGVGLLLAGGLPARLAGTVREVVMLKWSLLIPAAGSLFLLGGFCLEAPIWYTIPVLFVTIVPLSAMGAASTALALTRLPAGISGSASALLGFFSMILGGLCMPLTGIAGDHSALPMGILMTAGYLLAVLAFYRVIWRGTGKNKRQ